MKVELTKAELDMIVQLMDVGCKAVGLQAVKPETLSVLNKFTAAIQEVNRPKEDTLDG